MREPSKEALDRAREIGENVIGNAIIHEWGREDHDEAITAIAHALDARFAEGRAAGIREAAEAVDRFASTGSCAHEVYGKHAALAVRALLPLEPEERGGGC